MKVIVTGAAGFIGMHAALRLLERGDAVLGVDNLNEYYDVSLKHARLARLTPFANFTFAKLDIADRIAVEALFKEARPDAVINLAAQAGVRYSILNPEAYVDSNLKGFLHILEGCRHHGVKHLVYASSSSVYGGNTKMPFSEDDNVDRPVSLYAATKKANELMAHSYSHLYSLTTTGLRFFTVYGPWGRPDMALFLFTDAILKGRAIDVFNHGQMVRDFTYDDDIVEGVIRVLDKPLRDGANASASRPKSGASAYARVFNIGNGQPVQLLDYIKALEQALGMEAKMNLVGMQPGDVTATYADCRALDAWVGFKPGTPVTDGVAKFVAWYRNYYRAN